MGTSGGQNRILDPIIAGVTGGCELPNVEARH